MTVGINMVPGSSAELLGDPHPLLEQLGAPEDLVPADNVPATIAFGRVVNLNSLRRFLDDYRAQILIPVELPTISAACRHAARGELKELLSLDERLALEPALRRFAAASCRVGQRQLSRLRPLRDQRLVQRYLAAIAAGQARGWHTLVYGVSLAMFSLPLRQGLQNYAEQTARGFILSAVRSLRLGETDCHALLAENASEVPRAVSLALEAKQPLLLVD